MRIAHLPSSYFPDTLGGTEVYVQTLCNGLEELGLATAVVWHSNAARGLPNNALPLGAIASRRRSHLYTKFTGHVPPGFQDFLRDWKPDVVHFHAFTLGAGVDHADFCRRENIPYVVTYHTPAMSCPRGTLLRWGKEACDGRIDGRRCAACSLHARGWPKALARLASFSPLPNSLLAESPLLSRVALPSILAESATRWRQFFAHAKKVIACAEFCRDVLINNGVPLERIVLERQALTGEDRLRSLRLPLRVLPERPLRLGYFGRITKVKGPDVLPEVVELLRRNGNPAMGEWVGPINCDRRWAEAMFIAGAPHVRYAGVKHGDELETWIRNCDLILIPSRCLETGPLTLLEAWDQGTPVIGVDRGGIRDFMIANDLHQCLFTADAPAEMVDAVRRMLTWNAPPPVVKVPGMRSLADRMLAIYGSACQDGDQSLKAASVFNGSKVAITGCTGGHAS